MPARTATPRRPPSPTRGRIYIGTSGWTYRAWRDVLYRGIPTKRWLAHAAATFGALEINGSFYTQIRESTYARWRDETPADCARPRARRHVSRRGLVTGFVQACSPARPNSA